MQNNNYASVFPKEAFLSPKAPIKTKKKQLSSDSCLAKVSYSLSIFFALLRKERYIKY